MSLQEAVSSLSVRAVTLGFAVGISFEVFIRGSPLGLQFPLWVLLFIIGLRWVGRANHARSEPRVLWWEVQLLFFSSWVAMRDSALLTAMNVGACLWLAARYCSNEPGLVWRPLKTYVTAPFVAIKALNAGGARLPSNVFRHHGGTMLRSLLFMLPVGWLFASLLNSADPSFGDALTLPVQKDFFVSAFVTVGVALVAIGLSLRAHSGIVGAPALSIPP